MISYECTKKIIEQMEKYICKIKIGQEQGTGFFCKIPFPDKNHMLTVFITNNHVINEQTLNNKDEKILYMINKDSKYKEINKLGKRMTYTNKEYDVTIIEIIEDDEIKEYLELDEKIIDEIISNNNQNDKYIDETIYIIQYPKGELSVSNGLLLNISADNKYDFVHRCSTDGGSSGSPILNLKNKLIGIHKETDNNNKNKGTFLNFPIKEFIKIYYNEYKNNKTNNKNIIDDGIEDIKNEILNEDNKKYNKNDSSFLKNEIDKFSNCNNKFNNNPSIFIDDKDKLILKESYNNNFLLNKKSNDINEIGKNNINKKENEILNKLGITNNQIEELNLSKKWINNGNEGLKELSEIKLNNLKKIDLQYNKITDINILKDFKFEKLEKLNLGFNEISNINVLEKVNFLELKELYLNNNKIVEIKVLGNFRFEKLEKLNLGFNKISNINILSKVNFKELKELFLDYNEISDINILEKVNFGKLEILNLGINKIRDINIIGKLNFLKKIYLESNQITNINVFGKISFSKLEKLDLRYNNIDGNMRAMILKKLGNKLGENLKI